MVHLQVDRNNTHLHSVSSQHFTINLITINISIIEHMFCSAKMKIHNSLQKSLYFWLNAKMIFEIRYLILKIDLSTV